MRAPVIQVVRESPPRFDEYGRVPIAFEVRAVLDVVPTSRAEDSFALGEHRVETPYVKDYDALPDESPWSWPERFDTSGWAMFAAHAGGARVGGAVGVMRSADVDMLDGRADLALLWDLRVAPSWRGRGAGRTLLAAVEQWARDSGARELKVETQDINVPACRFYERNGFVLRAVDRHAYPDHPGEAQLLWYKDLDAGVNQ